MLFIVAMWFSDESGFKPPSAVAVEQKGGKYLYVLLCFLLKKALAQTLKTVPDVFLDTTVSYLKQTAVIQSQALSALFCLHRKCHLKTETGKMSLTFHLKYLSIGMFYVPCTSLFLARREQLLSRK